MSKKIRLLFTISVLLNVLLLGVSGGLVIKNSYHRPSWDKVKEGLSPETRNLMAREFQKAHRDMKPLGEEARKARKDVMNALSRKEFSESEFDTAMERLQKAQKNIMEKKIEATKALAAELPVGERKKLAEHFSLTFGGKHSRGGRDPEKHDYPRPQSPVEE